MSKTAVGVVLLSALLLAGCPAPPPPPLLSLEQVVGKLNENNSQLSALKGRMPTVALAAVDENGRTQRVTLRGLMLYHQPIDFYMEAIPEGHNLLIHNLDKPGVIARIATVLGKHDINISRMQVGEEKAKKQNVILLTTNVSVSDDILEEMRGLENVFSARKIEL